MDCPKTGFPAPFLKGGAGIRSCSSLMKSHGHEKHAHHSNQSHPQHPQHPQHPHKPHATRSHHAAPHSNGHEPKHTEPRHSEPKHAERKHAEHLACLDDRGRDGGNRAVAAGCHDDVAAAFGGAPDGIGELLR
jgi:hypothetical protein